MALEHEDLRQLADAYASAEDDARALVAGLGAEEGAWRPRPDAWSIAECLDHLATANRVYLEALGAAAARGRARGRRRRRPAVPGWLGGMFVRSMEPPAEPATMRRMRAPRSIQPRTAPPLADAVAAFVASHADVVAFLHANADLDLAGIRFVNPFVAGVRFSLATGLHVIAAHERRHLAQARRVLEAMPRRLVDA